MTSCLNLCELGHLQLFILVALESKFAEMFIARLGIKSASDTTFHVAAGPLRLAFRSAQLQCLRNCMRPDLLSFIRFSFRIFNFPHSQITVRA